MIERYAAREHSGSSGVGRSGAEEAILRRDPQSAHTTEASHLATLRGGILYSNEEKERVNELFKQQAEIGAPMREIEVTPIEEPVPDVTPAEEPGESPAEPVRRPERVPA